MKKVPNICPKDLLEVKQKRKMGIKYATLKRKYNISYNDIKKIVRFFAECELESDIVDELERIKSHNIKCTTIDYKGNYQKYKKYYLKYSKQQYKNRINV